MTNETEIQTRGRMEMLLDNIKVLSRERHNLIRPLHDRLNCTLLFNEMPKHFDFQAAQEELQSVARTEARLTTAIADYNALALSINQPQLRRGE